MTIRVRCSCGQKLKARNDQAGQEFECPNCGTPVIFPADNGTDVAQTVNSGIPSLQPDSSHSPTTSKYRILDSWRDQLPLWLSSSALLLAVIALLMQLFSSPLGSGIAAYDFSSPEEALRSQLEIQRNRDFLAMMEMDELRGGHRVQEKLSTIKVHNESDYEGKKLLFITYKENGITKYDTQGFEKNADTGFWFPAFIVTYDMDDPDLESAIRDWEERSGTVAELSDE